MDNFILRLWDNDNESFSYLDFNNLEKCVETLSSYQKYFGKNYFLESKSDELPLISYHFGRFDKNNKQIFSGDIVVSNCYPFFDNETQDDNKYNYVGLVMFDVYSAMFYIDYIRVSNRVAGRATNATFEDFKNNHLEIIGNIYTTPNLLDVIYSDLNKSFKRN